MNTKKRKTNIFVGFLQQRETFESFKLSLDLEARQLFILFRAFGIFDPLKVPEELEPGFQDYGNQYVQVLANHFYKDSDGGKKSQLLSEWQNFKYFVNTNLKPNVPNDVKTNKVKITPTQWMLQQMLRDVAMKKHYPLLTYIAEVAITLPVSNAWPERGASALKVVKTKQRNRFSSKMLESLLHVSINGPSPTSAEGKHMVKLSVKNWLSVKPRRRLPKQVKQVNNVTGSEAVKAVAVEDTGCQTDPVEGLNTTMSQMVTAQVRLAAEKLYIQLEKDYEYDSGLDDEFGSDDDFDDIAYAKM